MSLSFKALFQYAKSSLMNRSSSARISSPRCWSAAFLSANRGSSASSGTPSTLHSAGKYRSYSNIDSISHSPSLHRYGAVSGGVSSRCFGNGSPYRCCARRYMKLMIQIAPPNRDIVT